MRTAEEKYALDRLKELMLSTLGHSFENERENALVAAQRLRMRSHKLAAPRDYLALVLGDPRELARLTELLTVNETYFFREPIHLRLMAEKLLPQFVASAQGRPVRIISAGCSTGEEPYSVAMLLRDMYGDQAERLFSILGVDVDAAAVAGAKDGVYGRHSFRSAESYDLSRYFEPCGDCNLRVREHLRRQVAFEVVNLLGECYPQAMNGADVILYRNVSIYFPQELQRKIFARLAGILADGGCLMVGAAETIHHDIGVLSLVEQDGIFFYRKPPSPSFGERRSALRHAPYREKTTYQPPATLKYGAEGLKGEPPTATPPDDRVCFDEALECARGGKIDKAHAILDAIISRNSAFTKARTLKGSLFLSVSNYEESQAICEEVVKLDPLCLEAYLMLGIAARHRGKTEEALKRFREAIYLDPACWLAHFNAAEILFVQNDGKRAKNSYEAAARILENGSTAKHGQEFFPLVFNAEQFVVICRHKLSLLKETR